MSSTANTSRGVVPAQVSRWPQLLFGIVCMVAASNIQYSWTQFVPEIRKAHGWERAAIQTAFSIFVVVQTWSTPFIGHFIDRYGPRVLVLVRRRADRPGLGHQLLRHHAPRLLRRVGGRRSRSRRRVRDLHQQLVEVVSGQTRPGSRVDGGRLRFRHDPHGHPDREHDRDRRIPGRVLYLWLDPGRGDLPLRLVPARASARRDHVFGEGRAVAARLHPRRGTSHTGVLGHAGDVHRHGHRRPDGRGSAERDRSRTSE